ncbi:MAG TPA: DUF4270 family protein [Bacteroidetes bacterium]|mgnify:CR=1 FL=1|nr:DUF4270 family protein [Bacteroidota bacterium]
MTKSNFLFKTLKKPTKNLFSFSLLITLSLLLWQCVSPPDFLGGDLLPEDDFVKVKTDTSFIVSAYTQRYDTVNTLDFAEAIIGETWDEVFGRTKASFLTQIKLGYLDKFYGTNPSIDSAFLYLKLSDQLGEVPMFFAVYELSDSLSADSIYNAIDPLGDNVYNTEPIGETPNGYTGQDDIIKIPINTSWIFDKLIDPITEDSTIVESQDNFLKHLYGLYVAPTSPLSAYGKGMYYINYPSTDSKMVVYYKNDEQEVDTISQQYTYVFASSNLRYNHFQHSTEEASSEVAVQFNYNPDEPLVQDSVFYIKGLGLARGVIVLEDVVSWLDSMPIAINRAELRFELEEHENLPDDTLINKLFLYRIVDNERVALTDYLVDNASFGGSYSKSKKYYSFNITYHLQSLLQEANPDLNIYVEQINAYLRANGAVLRSGNHSSRIKLIITYTKL